MWKVVACACFASINGMVRYLSGGVPSLGVEAMPYYEIAFLQNLIGALFLLPWILKNGTGPLKTSMPGYHALRVFFAVAGLVLWYGALFYMPLAHAVALAFTGPIFTIIGCRIFLKEELTLPRILAILVSFAGAFFITRPDKAFLTGEGLTAELGLYTLLPLVAAIAWVGSKITGRILASRGEPARRMTIYLLVFMAPVSLLPALPVWITPTSHQLMWVTIIGITSCAAHLSIARSYALADVSFLMPFGFSRLLLSGIIGYVAFGEMPKNVGLWVGVAIISLSLILLAYDSKKRKLSVSLD